MNLRRVIQDAESRLRGEPGTIRALHELVAANAHLYLLDSHRERGETEESKARRDSETMIIAARALEHVIATVYEEPFPELRGDGDLLPDEPGIPEDAKTFTYYVFSRTGMARFSSSYSARTAPRASLQGAQVTGRVEGIESSYGWEARDMRYASRAGLALDAELAIADRRSHARLVNDVVLWGVESLGLPGFLTHPNINDNDAPNGDWSSATVDEIIADCRFLINTVNRVTLGMRNVTDVALPNDKMTLIRTMRLGNGDGTLTVYNFLQAAFPGVTWSVLNELAADMSSGHLDADAAVAYCRNPAYVSRVRPMAYRQWPVQQQGLSFMVPTESSIGGVKMVEPLTVHVMHGI